MEQNIEGNCYIWQEERLEKERDKDSNQEKITFSMSADFEHGGKTRAQKKITIEKS